MKTSSRNLSRNLANLFYGEKAKIQGEKAKYTRETSLAVTKLSKAMTRRYLSTLEVTKGYNVHTKKVVSLPGICWDLLTVRIGCQWILPIYFL